MSRDSLPATGRRSTDTAPSEAETKIEVTPAMLAAGAEVLFDWALYRLTPEQRQSLARDVYAAMSRHRT